MDIAKLILEYISVLIYPVLILTISLIFKKNIKELLTGKLTATYKDLTLTIEKQKKELEAVEGKTELALRNIEKAQEVKQLDSPKQTEKSDDYIDNAIKLLSLTSEEYQIIEALQKAPEDVVDKGILIRLFTDPRMDMHTFYQYKNGIEKTIDNLIKKGIITQDKGGIQFTHKLLKEIKFK